MYCTACELCQTSISNCLGGVGNSKAKIMIVGPYPNHGDDRDGESYISDTAAKLKFLCEKAKIPYHKLYLTNAIRCKPPKGKTPSGKHVEACSNHLIKEILRVKPKIIVAMGDPALKSLINETGIKDHRCDLHEFEIEYTRNGKTKTFVAPVIATYAPAGCLQKWELDDLVIRDLQDVKKYLKTGKSPYIEKIKYFVADTPEKLRKAKETLMKVKRFSFDFETTGLDFHKDKIILAVFSYKKGRSIVIPCHPYPNEYTKKFTQQERKDAEKISDFVNENKKEIFKTLKDLFASGVYKIAHNGKFDCKFARSHKIPVKNFKFDTILAHSLLDENKPHTLTFLTNWYRLGYGSYEQELWPYVGKTNKKCFLFIPPKTLHKYAAMDAEATLQLYFIFKPTLKKEKLFKLFIKQQMPLTHVLIDIECRGVRIDVDALNKFSRNLQGRITIVNKDLCKIVKDKNFNPNSPKQIREYLEKADAPLTKLTGGGDYSTDVDVLEALSKKKKFKKFANRMLELRSVIKLKGTYLDGSARSKKKSGILHKLDHRNFLHCTFNPHTPVTGRLSSSDPNLQNIPRYNPKFPDINIRTLFIPSKDNWVFGSVDFKQLEMRIVAFLSRDYVMIQEIRDGVDLHSRNAIMFGKDLDFLPENMTEEKFIKILKYEAPENWEQCEKAKKIKRKIQRAAEYVELRVNTKTLGFGVNYGKEAYTLAEEFEIDIELVEKMLELYFEKYYKISTWREKQKELAIDRGYLILPETRRKRRFTCSDWFESEYSMECWKRSIDMDAVKRQGMNFPVQGYANEIFTAGGNYKQGKLFLDREMKRLKMQTKIRLSLHDGLLIDGPRSEMPELEVVAKRCLERVLGEGKKHEVPLDIDFDVYDKWSGNKLKI